SATDLRNTAVPDTWGMAGVGDSGCHASFPRWRTLRRIRTAASARIGAMKSETLAPSGMSFPEIAQLNAQVAKTWVWSTGPPLVKILTISKLAKVTIRENNAVI